MQDFNGSTLRVATVTGASGAGPSSARADFAWDSLKSRPRNSGFASGCRASSPLWCSRPRPEVRPISESARFWGISRRSCPVPAHNSKRASCRSTSNFLIGCLGPTAGFAFNRFADWLWGVFFRYNRGNRGHGNKPRRTRRLRLRELQSSCGVIGSISTIVEIEIDGANGQGILFFLRARTRPCLTEPDNARIAFKQARNAYDALCTFLRAARRPMGAARELI